MTLVKSLYLHNRIPKKHIEEQIEETYQTDQN